MSNNRASFAGWLKLGTFFMASAAAIGFVASQYGIVEALDVRMLHDAAEVLPSVVDGTFPGWLLMSGLALAAAVAGTLLE